ncbi:MAG: hypothetical protein IJU48_09195 [Synergistaceae bacterium]|nr:hypothetical protein [Synergistaceae bacterium]
MTCLTLETTSIFLVAVTFFFTIYCFTADRKNLSIALTFFIVSVIAFLIFYFAPATTKRMLKLPFLTHLFRALLVSAAFGFFTVLKFFVKPVIYVFLLFLPEIARLTPTDKFLSKRLKAWHIVSAVILVALMNQFVGGWAQGAGLEFRGESLAIWMMGAVWIFLWAFFYRGKLSQPGTSKIYSFKWVLLIISLLVSSNFIGAVHDFGIREEYRAEYETLLKVSKKQINAGVKDVYVPITELSPKILNQAPWRQIPSAHFANIQYSEYYKLNSFTALPQSMLDDEAAMSRWREGDVQDFLKAAEGREYLSFLAGEMYDKNFRGIPSVPKDDDKAIEWYTKAYELGNVQSCRRLTRIYFLNKKSYFDAGMWFIRSELPFVRP